MMFLARTSIFTLSVVLCVIGKGLLLAKKFLVSIGFLEFVVMCVEKFFIIIVSVKMNVAIVLDNALRSVNIECF